MKKVGQQMENVGKISNNCQQNRKTVFQKYGKVGNKSIAETMWELLIDPDCVLPGQLTIKGVLVL